MIILFLGFSLRQMTGKNYLFDEKSDFLQIRKLKPNRLK